MLFLLDFDLDLFHLDLDLLDLDNLKKKKILIYNKIQNKSFHNMFKILLLKELFPKIRDINSSILNLTINQINIFNQYSYEFQSNIWSFVDKDYIEYILLISGEKFKKECGNRNIYGENRNIYNFTRPECKDYINNNKEYCEINKEECNRLNQLFFDNKNQEKLFEYSFRNQINLIIIGRTISTETLYKFLKLPKKCVEFFLRRFATDIYKVAPIRLQEYEKPNKDNGLNKDDMKLIFNFPVDQIKKLLDNIFLLPIQTDIKNFLKTNEENKEEKIKAILDQEEKKKLEIKLEIKLKKKIRNKIKKKIRWKNI